MKTLSDKNVPSTMKSYYFIRRAIHGRNKAVLSVLAAYTVRFTMEYPSEKLIFINWNY